MAKYSFKMGTDSLLVLSSEYRAGKDSVWYRIEEVPTGTVLLSMFSVFPHKGNQLLL